MAWLRMVVSGTGLLELIDEVTADGKSRMMSEMYSAIVSVQIEPNAAKSLWPSDAQQSTKANQGNEMGYPSITKSVDWSRPDRGCATNKLQLKVGEIKI